MRVWLIGAMVAMTVGPAAARSQKQDAVPAALAGMKTFACSFPTYATARWTDPPQTTTGSQTLSFGLEIVDAKKHQARVVGATVSVPAALVIGQTGVTIIEQTPIGNVNVTTIFVAGGQGTKFLAVHSRHIGDLTATPTASQSYGTCDGSK